MKLANLKKAVHIGAAFLLLTLTLFIVNSCRKEIRLGPLSTATDSVNFARQWYESTYPAAGTYSAKQMASVTGQKPALNNFIKPDWKHANSYKRFNKNVVELPLNDSTKLGFSPAKTSFSFDKNASKSSFLIMNDDQNYTAYLMTILADSSYLQNDYTKLARNSYSKRDANFSGFVFYSTPDGSLLKGWHYLNGKVDKIVSPSASSQPPALQVQSLAAAKKTDDVSNCYIQEYSLYLGTYCLSTFDYAPTCTDYYADYNEQICDTQSLPPDDNPGGSSGPGFPDPSGNPTPPPVINDPCATAKGATANSDFNAKIADLKNYTSDTNGEHGWVYSQNADGSFSYKPLTSTTDPNSIDIPLTTVISNLLHNHFTGQLLNFSDDDIAAPFIIYNNKFMANTTSFTSTVVTPYGTYMLVISDPAEFKAFASNNPQSTIQTSLSLFGYSTSTSGPDAEKIIAKVLANINGGTGLSLLRQDSDGFKLLTIIGNQVNTTNCN